MRASIVPKLPSRRTFLTRSAAISAAVGTPLGASWATARAAESYTLRFSLNLPADSVQGRAVVRYASAVARRTNGQVKIEVYPDGQLVKEQETINALISGIVDFSIQASPFLAPLFPHYQVFDMPFLFKDVAAGFRVLDGPIGAEFLGELESKGLIGIGFGTSGFRQLETVSKPVVTPDDMKGMRVRIQSGAIYPATFTALGAIPVLIDVTEVYTALTQHTVEAVDLPLESFLARKLQTIVKHVAMTNYVFSILTMLGSKLRIGAMPAPLQKIVRDEGKAVIPFWRAQYGNEFASNIDLLKKNGVTFTEIQYPAFRKAVEPVYAAFSARLGADLLDRISRAAGVT